MTDNPLMPFGDLSRPATLLIEKVSDALGGLFKPSQIVRVAKAEAAAECIRAESEIEITELCRRAVQRVAHEETKYQSNIEAITAQALPHLNDDASPDKVADDWMTNFFDKSRIISDAEMQKIWSRILAGEANHPGAFSRRTVNLVGDLDACDAQLFTRLCGFNWTIFTDLVPLVDYLAADVYEEKGITFSSLSDLQALGLIRFNHLTNFSVKVPRRILEVSYYDRQVRLTFPKEDGNELALGKVLFTKAGREIAAVCGADPVEGFFEFVVRRSWEADGLSSDLDQNKN